MKLKPEVGLSVATSVSVVVAPPAISVAASISRRRSSRPSVPDRLRASRAYFQQRSFRVVEGAIARPGQRVSLLWVPANDEWYGYDASTAVHLERGGARIATVEKHQGLSGRDGRVEFPVPRVAPGPALLSVTLMYLEPRPHVDGCRGLHLCAARMPSGVPRPTIPIVIHIVD